MSQSRDNTRQIMASNDINDNKAFTVRSTLNSAVAGYVAGIAGVVVGHPLDSAKVWLQTNSVGQNRHLLDTSTTKRSAPKAPSASSSSAIARSAAASSSSSSVTTASANMSTLSSSLSETTTRAPTKQGAFGDFSLKSSARTLRALYSGISMPLATIGIVQSVNFAAYDGIRRSLHQRDHPNNTNEKSYLENDSLENVTVAGFLSGSLMAFLTAPMLLVKTRQQITGNGIRQTLVESFRGGGGSQRPAFMLGFGPHFLAESAGRGVYFAAYEYCKREFASHNNNHGGDGPSSSSISLQQRMLSAGTAGTVCWLLIFPFDSLRSRLYGQISTHPKNTMEMMRSMYSENGLRSFYRGFSITVLRAGPVAAVILPMYDYVLDTLVLSQQ